MEHGRSFENGRRMFEVANCFACHKLNGMGTELGPDLTKLEAKLTREDILRDILEPSFRINEKYQPYTFETDSGQFITGLIIKETPKAVEVIENPLAKTKPVVLKPSEIVERKKSPVSIMPKGLLDKLTKEEILDLVAYVISRGNPKDKLFQRGHEHGHGHGSGH
jgi:putative heme-binding domain-containing protein